MVTSAEPPTFRDTPATPLNAPGPRSSNPTTMSPEPTDLVVLAPAGEGVLRLTLNRPHALNALDRGLTAALEQALERVATMDAIRVLVVCGQGRAFCAGNDIKEMETVTGDEAQALASRQAALMDRFSRLPLVTLAAIDGHALGGGLMLAVAQDLRIASDRARFGLPEVTLGFNPAYGIARLLDVTGGAHGRDLLLTGRTIHASEALRLGLVNRVVAPPTLDASALKWAAEIAASPREGLAATKEIVAAIRSGGHGHEANSYGAALKTSEAARARIRAFSERRRPR
jgi:enoyl-CoA hydratase